MKTKKSHYPKKSHYLLAAFFLSVSSTLSPPLWISEAHGEKTSNVANTTPGANPKPQTKAEKPKSPSFASRMIAGAKAKTEKTNAAITELKKQTSKVVQDPRYLKQKILERMEPTEKRTGKITDIEKTRYGNELTKLEGKEKSGKSLSPYEQSRRNKLRAATNSLNSSQTKSTDFTNPQVGFTENSAPPPAYKAVVKAPKNPDDETYHDALEEKPPAYPQL